MDDLITKEAVGFAGGIWVAWDSRKIYVELLTSNEQVMTAIISEGGQLRSLLSIIYASLNFTYRQQLWQYLLEIGRCINVPWALMGAYN